MADTTLARFWLRFFLAGFAVIIALLVVTLFTQAPYGDLTRIGRLSETDFGWKTPPPVVPEEYIHGSSLEQADVVVVGDSFSMTLRWQSVLVKSGYRVATIYWGQTGFLCKDFTSWIRRAGFRGKVLIVESVERETGERVAGGTECETMLPAPVAKAVPFMQPVDHVPVFELNWNAKITTGVITYFNTRSAEKALGDTLFNKTQVRPVPNGCTYFSHRLCNKGLFYVEDVEKPPLGSADAAKMLAFNRFQPDLKTIWMVIPDKTTVYLDTQRAPEFRRAFQAEKLGPDLFSFAIAQRDKTPDFYFTNDTHMSMQGQLALGERMLAAVREVLPTPPAQNP